ncbi:sodium-coupled monocarboxylate transporter 1 [Rhipicephalus sanguineus]|uniref:sodium-coupled monocarboxylate transporter 1 n=1 Tax=Rhipicephalus sanguineus TaxID=34632 RepID=UPI001893B1E7|nr:sodium-coupled monocarboxylate transporter 1 [Rhipicephalus sanguineus]
MAAHTFVALDYAVLISFLVLSAGIGVYFAWHDRRGNSNRQFLTANRQLNWLPVSMSMMASFLSAASVLGVPAEVFVRGSTFWYGSISTTLAILMAAFIFMPMYYKMDITSINEYLEKRFSSRAIRKIGSILFIVHTLLYLGVALYGPSLALGSVTGFPVWSSILLNGAVCTFYTSIGGIKAVVWTDVVQVILIYVAYIMVIASGLHHLGGFGAMWQIAGDGGRLIFNNFSLSPYETYTTWTMVFSWTITWMGMYCANQTQAQRYASIGSLRGARIALMLNIPGTILNVSMAVLSGLTLYAVYGNCDPRLTGDIRKADQLMPYIVQDMLHNYPGLSGLLATAVYSSSLSTLSSGYNALAAVTWEDFMRPWIKSSEATALRITKLTAASYGLVSIAVAFLVGTMESIVQAASSLSGALCGPMVAVFVLGFLFPCCKKKGAIVGTLVSIIISGWMALGSILYPRKPYALPTTTAGCSHFNETITSGSYESPPWPSGIYQLYHISFMWVAFVGFVVDLIVSLAVSLAFEWRGSEVVDPTYVCPLVRKYMRKNPEVSDERDEKVKETLLMDVATTTELKVPIFDCHQRA